MKKIIAILLSFMLAFGVTTSALATADPTDSPEMTTMVTKPDDSKFNDEEIPSTTFPAPSTDAPTTEAPLTTAPDISIEPELPPIDPEIPDTEKVGSILDRIYTAIRNFITEIVDIISQIIGKCDHSNCEMKYVTIPPYPCCDGYSGDLYCLDCGEIIHFGSIIQADMSHTYKAYSYCSADDTIHFECIVCHSAYMSAPMSPLNIDYIGTENNVMHFYCNAYTDILSITYIDGNSTHTSPSEIEDFYITLPTENEIITITVEEYIGPGEMIRKATKSFNTQTKTWVEV